MSTVFTVVVISLFVLTPLSVLLASTKEDNDASMIASVVVTVFTHVTFWVTCYDYLFGGSQPSIAVVAAMMYQLFAAVSVAAAIYEWLEEKTF